MNHELPDVQTVFKKCRGTRDQTANIRWIIKTVRELQKKHLLLPLLPTLKPLTVWIKKKTVENSSRDGNTRSLDLPPEKSVYRSRINKLVLDMEQQTGSKLGKEYVKAVYCHPAYIT